MSETPDLDRAYALETPADSVQLYADWAESYDHSFAQASGYILHLEVARHFALMGGFGPVLDVGAGTGLCGQALAARGIGPVDGTDISPQMLAEARTKGTYRHLFEGNLLEGLTIPVALYQGAVSSGTFTHGHVGPAGIDTVLDMVRPGGWIVLSVNAQHFQAAGFAAKMDESAGRITDLSQTEVAIYAPDSTGPHAQDTALLLAFRKA
ncbi:class I SAM-dependent methyltransferase [uncultured Tateyamaria sp.]|uniref:class I SAM-dependent DNA methyltransferase n=1 Tax=uncultured Tateyamaria sp. TaxID=455651 RepID=UPI0026237AF0|nr:class I SAM-dependent methyltransferase [uncultured Tateyamaria sp.]